MKGCIVHGANDIRIEEVPEQALDAQQVRLQFAYGGICGSDLHYFLHGRVGNSVVIDPMVLGHEFSATVLEIGAEVRCLAIGDPVVINPALACGTCRYCQEKKYNLCENMRYLGSAAKRPHQPGGFVERPVVHQSQCVKLPKDADLRLAALAEPYSVARHAANQAGNLASKRIFIIGAGPIGCLISVAVKLSGAAHVTVSDITDAPLQRVLLLGADQVINVSTANQDPAILLSSNPPDVVIEASGTPAGLDCALRTVRSGGRIVQVGMLPAGSPINLNLLVTKEVELVGAYRFNGEFTDAVQDIVSGKVDLSAAVTGTFNLQYGLSAFDAAGDRNQHMKVLVHF